MELVPGVEPGPTVYETVALPLSYTSKTAGVTPLHSPGGCNPKARSFSPESTVLGLAGRVQRHAQG